MKKVFLVFGLAAFSTASAQQEEFFDIQQHLLKKSAEEKKLLQDNKAPFLLQDLRQNQASSLFQNGPLGFRGDGSMPCIKPDMRELQVMPNPGLGVLKLYYRQPGQVPNVADVPPKTIAGGN